MVLKKFFDESLEQSQIKAAIVEKYFDAWAGIITATQRRNGVTGLTKWECVGPEQEQCWGESH